MKSSAKDIAIRLDVIIFARCFNFNAPKIQYKFDLTTKLDRKLKIPPIFRFGLHLFQQFIFAFKN